MQLGFSEVIRRIETRIEGVDGFAEDYVEFDPRNVSADSTPIAADFINTNLTRSNTGQFVQLNFSFLAQHIGDTHKRTFHNIYSRSQSFYKVWN